MKLKDVIHTNNCIQFVVLLIISILGILESDMFYYMLSLLWGITLSSAVIYLKFKTKTNEKN